jgi:hypothetical protein
MVWHDCMVVPGWIDMQKSPANIREGCVVEEKRDMRLWTLLWCGIPSFRTPSCDVACDAPDPGDVSDEIAFVRQLDVIARFHAIAGFDPMTHWESTPDGLVQTAVYGDDGSVTVDFRRNHYRLSASGLKEEGMAE